MVAPQFAKALDLKSRNALYNWGSSASDTIPSKIYFLKMYTLYIVPVGLVAPILVAYRYAAENQLEGSNFSILINSGFFNTPDLSLSAIAQICSLSSAKRAPWHNQISWLGKKAADIIVGPTLVEATANSSCDKIPKELIPAFQINHSKSWETILKQIT